MDQPSGWRLWLAGARPRTLPAAVVPVLVGTATATGLGVGGDVDGPLQGIVLWRFAAAMVVALALQVGTNYANDYSDGKRGTDSADRVGPLRLVGSGLAAPASVKRAAMLSFAVAAVVGFALAAAAGWILLLVGAVSIAAGWFYTGGPRPYGYAGLGEVFVFVFFGLVATAGSSFVQSEQLTWLAVAAGVPVGMFATGLLVVNNLRDIPTDAVAGKRTLAVKLGDHRTRVLYVALMVLPFVVTPVIAGASGRLVAWLAMFTILAARIPVQRILEGAKGAALIPILGQTGRVQLLFGIVFAVGLWVGPV